MYIIDVCLCVTIDYFYTLALMCVCMRVCVCVRLCIDYLYTLALTSVWMYIIHVCVDWLYVFISLNFRRVSIIHVCGCV